MSETDALQTLKVFYWLTVHITAEVVENGFVKSVN